MVRGLGRVLTLLDTRVLMGWAALCFLPAGLWLRSLPEAVPNFGMEEWDRLPLLLALQKGAQCRRDVSLLLFCFAPDEI